MTGERNAALKPPFLMIKRFAVTAGGSFAYDQAFRLGVNIIRGDNTTGKSSILDLMHYALGAEVTDWTTEQQACDQTLLEVRLNYADYCLRREITDTGKSAMHIFEGTLEEALKDSGKWLRFPNKRSDSTQSYSQKLFSLLSLPSHKTDEAKNLTMHQILRLMYIDQLSETTRLLKEDRKFDNATLRRAIGEYLLGIDDLDAHNARQELIEANSRFDKANAELRAIYRFVGSTNSIIREEHIDREIQSIENDIAALETKKDELRKKRQNKLDSRLRNRASQILEEIDEATKELQEALAERRELRSELSDTALFVQSLDHRLWSLEQSRLTNEVLGDLVFKYCPACLNPVKEQEPEHGCALCKEDISDSHRHYAYLQMSSEIEFQKTESLKLLETFKARTQHLNSRIPSISRKLQQLKYQYRELTSNTNTAEAMLSDIDNEIGYRRGTISSLEEKRTMVEEVERLVSIKEEAQNEINKLKNRLELIEAASRNRLVEVYSNIEEIAATILHMDGGYEDAFENVEEVSFDFARDKMSINGRSKFSASSMVIMKNSIRLAIYLHCINDKSSRFPRLCLIDNIEDKGMTESRSQNFQRHLVSLCDEIETDYQLIFTTSMIDPDLDKSEYVIGPHYRKGEHTLKL